MNVVYHGGQKGIPGEEYKNRQTFTLTVFQGVLLATRSKRSVSSEVKFMIC